MFIIFLAGEPFVMWCVTWVQIEQMPQIWIYQPDNNISFIHNPELLLTKSSLSNYQNHGPKFIKISYTASPPSPIPRAVR